MGRYCLVPGCTSGHCRIKAQEGVSVHCLPKEDGHAQLWINATKRKQQNILNIRNTGVCSLHFLPDDFIRDFRFELTNPGKDPMANSNKKLKDNAVPSQNLPNQTQKSRPSGLLSARKERQAVIDGSLAGTSCSAPMTTADDQQTAEQMSPPPGQSYPELEFLRRKVAHLEEALRRQTAQLEAKDLDVAAHYRDKLKGLFTDQQIEVLLNSTRPCPWDDDTVHKALLFRSRLSRRQYNYLRDAGMPLPSLTTLKSRLKELTIRQGDTDFPTTVLENYLRDKPDRDRPCVLMFDEMKIRSIADYDATDDQVLGPNEYLQQVMIRSIVGTWKMPLFFNFDTAVKKDLLEKLVTSVEAAGARVVAVVSDQGGSNRGLWTELGIRHDGDTHFTNPADKSRNIWVFADTPHLFKNLRNHLIDNGLKLPCGGLIDKQLFTDVLAIDAGKEFKILPKLGMESHVRMLGQARQRVRPAVQLLSDSVAAAVDTFLGRQEEARYLRVFDNGFDALNGQCPTDGKPLRRGIKATSGAHIKALEDLESAMKLKFRNKTSLLPFQKGFIVTIRSMRGLVGDLLPLLGPNGYVLSGRINQDILESFFGLVRGKGGANLHPSPSEAKCRVRSLTLMHSLRLGVNPLTLSVSPTESEDSAAVEDALFAEDLEEPHSEEQQLASDFEEARAMVEDAGRARPATTVAVASPIDPRTGVSAEQYAMAHAAGYLSAKCRKVDRSLGTPSAFADETALAETTWTRLRSQGGLSVPSAKWISQFRLMEEAFCIRHYHEPDHLSRSPRVVEELVGSISQKSDFPDARIVRRFIRLRTFIRISSVNKERRSRQQDASREATKRKQFAQ